MKKLFLACFAHAPMFSIVEGDTAGAASDAPVDPAPAGSTDLVGQVEQAADAVATATTDTAIAVAAATTAADDVEQAGAAVANDGAQAEQTVSQWISSELATIVADVEAGLHNGVDAIKSLISKL